MIIQHVRHGRTRRDAANLARHLGRRDDNEAVDIIDPAGLAASDIASALAAMQRLASKPNAAAFHHLSLSPGVDQSDADLRADARRVLSEMGAEDHAFVIVRHMKPSVAGRATSHVHLIVSHWGLSGKALNDGWLRLRLERLAREIEFDRCHPLTAGRHDKAIMKALRNKGRHDVADALQQRRPEEAPRSAITSDKRQALKRQGISDVEARAAVAQAWKVSDNAQSFRAALEAAGLSLCQGRKAGVWIVSNGEVEIGALDRLLRLKRGDVAQRLDQQPPSENVNIGELARRRIKISAELDELTSAALQRRQRASQPIAKPQTLENAESQVADIRHRMRQAEAQVMEAASSLAQCRARGPRGLWAWISGKTRRHRIEVGRLQEQMIAVTAKRNKLATKVDAAEMRLGVRLAAWAKKATEIDKDRKAKASAALRDLERIADARRLLVDDHVAGTVNDAAGLMAAFGRIDARRKKFGKPKADDASRRPETGAFAALTIRPPWVDRRPRRSRERS
jgi:hypothetical protein